LKFEERGQNREREKTVLEALARHPRFAATSFVPSSPGDPLDAFGEFHGERILAVEVKCREWVHHQHKTVWLGDHKRGALRRAYHEGLTPLFVVSYWEGDDLRRIYFGNLKRIWSEGKPEKRKVRRADRPDEPESDVWLVPLDRLELAYQDGQVVLAPVRLPRAAPRAQRDYRDGESTLGDEREAEGRDDRGREVGDPGGAPGADQGDGQGSLSLGGAKLQTGPRQRARG